jgi:hypothetical protein
MKNNAIILFIIVATACTAFSYPEPSMAARPGIWTLQTEILQPQQITVNIPSKGDQRFWYTILTVTNTADQDVRFFPKCQLMTDTFQITLAGEGTTSFVFDQLKKRYQGQYPFLESLDRFDRRVLEGSDNTRDIAIIWPDFDPQAKNIKLFIAGLSNEIIRIQHPAKIDDSGKPQEILLQKTLELEYSIGGDPARRAEALLTYTSKQWIMR